MRSREAAVHEGALVDEDAIHPRPPTPFIRSRRSADSAFSVMAQSTRPVQNTGTVPDGSIWPSTSQVMLSDGKLDRNRRASPLISGPYTPEREYGAKGWCFVPLPCF